jgi:hypothetical protein
MTGGTLGDALRATPAPPRHRPEPARGTPALPSAGIPPERANGAPPPEEETRRAPAIPARAAQTDFDDPAVAFLPSGSSADLLR